MCFSAGASFGVAAALLPVGAYCVEAAWRKDRAYLPLAAVPVLFGLQQLCEAQVWTGLGRGNPELTRGASLGFLFFALAVWPVWVPLAIAVIEPPGRKRWALYALAAAGVLFGAAYYGPIAAAGGRTFGPAAVGHSLRYDFSGVPAARGAGGWVCPAGYMAAVCAPFLVSRDRHLRPLGVGVAVTAVASYLMFELAFASVWCFFAAGLSAYLAYVLYKVPCRPAAAGGEPGTRLTRVGL
jgi:hypothetical protein